MVDAVPRHVLREDLVVPVVPVVVVIHQRSRFLGGLEEVKPADFADGVGAKERDRVSFSESGFPDSVISISSRQVS